MDTLYLVFHGGSSGSQLPNVSWFKLFVGGAQIEAESFNSNGGVGVESCSEGGQNVMDVGNGEWASATPLHAACRCVERRRSGSCKSSAAPARPLPGFPAGIPTGATEQRAAGNRRRTPAVDHRAFSQSSMRASAARSALRSCLRSHSLSHSWSALSTARPIGSGVREFVALGALVQHP
jgi:hypothetical protein